jgi:hypothetical protein
LKEIKMSPPGAEEGHFTSTSTIKYQVQSISDNFGDLESGVKVQGAAPGCQISVFPHTL